jgi:hypothetical protein
VHLAMASRGYAGTMPPLHHHARRPADLAVAALLPGAAAIVLVLAHATT